jgi:SAM-dependent methyltransferase
VPDSQTDVHALDDLLARLERERLEADRRYNDALTAVDRALQSVPALPAPPAPYDSSRLADLNTRFDILPDGPPPMDGSLKGRLRRLVWRLIGPPLETQKQFNAALVDHLNRNAAAHAASARSLASIIDVLGRELGALVRFQSLLIQSLQTITAYIDTKDRSLGGKEIRDRLALTEQRLFVLAREVEGRSSGGDHRAAPVPDVALGATLDVAPGAVFSGAVDSSAYVAFEDEFRGSPDEIRRRVEAYLPLLSSASDIVDLGCGRGELLGLLSERGVAARGVDANPAMVALCLSRGLDVQQGDALSYLERRDDGSIGALVAIQVVEHFTPAYLMKVLEAAFLKMRPGAPLVLETINPACWMAFFDTYLRDVTHQQPLHPDTLRLLVQASGFSRVDVQFREQIPEARRLDRIEPGAEGASVSERAAGLAEVVLAINAHADKLNRLLFSWMDYAVVARR